MTVILVSCSSDGVAPKEREAEGVTEWLPHGPHGVGHRALENRGGNRESCGIQEPPSLGFPPVAREGEEQDSGDIGEGSHLCVATQLGAESFMRLGSSVELEEEPGIAVIAGDTADTIRLDSHAPPEAGAPLTSPLHEPRSTALSASPGEPGEEPVRLDEMFEVLAGGDPVHVLSAEGRAQSCTEYTLRPPWLP